MDKVAIATMRLIRGLVRPIGTTTHGIRIGTLACVPPVTTLKTCKYLHGVVCRPVSGQPL
jgi:hypothetical protein